MYLSYLSEGREEDGKDGTNPGRLELMYTIHTQQGPGAGHAASAGPGERWPGSRISCRVDEGPRAGRERWRVDR